jgi:hypothetical protein
MSQRELDRAVREIRNEEIDEKSVREAARRVYSQLFDSVSHSDTVDRIKGCADFQTLIPAYLAHTLAPARSLLLEDHTSRCVECRRVLQELRGGVGREIPWSRRQVTGRTRRPVSMTKWALAASLAIGVAVGLTGWMNGFLPWQHAVRATVLNVEGRLYQVSDAGSALVAAGSVITNSQDLRTAKGSRALLRLASGAQLELGERSDVSVSRGWRGTTVSLEDGRMIVQASETHPGVFYVATDDVFIPVRSAVLAVNRGTKGSRVAVAKGSLHVEQGRRSFLLRAGQQMTTDERLATVPTANEFAWSKNAGSYLALLGEFSTIKKEIDSIAPAGPRYSSELAKYVPEDTVIYAAIPNVGGTITEAKRLFDDRLAQSPVLRDWWGQRSPSDASHFDQLVEQIGSISSYLGDEIVFSISSAGPHRYHGAVMLAKVSQPGLKEYLEQNNVMTPGLHIVDDPLKPLGATKGLLVWFNNVSGNNASGNNTLVATADPAELQRVAQTVQNPNSGQFAQSAFFQRIQQSYGAGAGYLLSIDMEQIVSNSVVNASQHMPPGMNNVQYAVLERRDIQGRTETRAALSFAGSRQGVASWLAAPGAMGSLDFVSPDASFATSFILRNPRSLLAELIGYLSAGNSRFTQELNNFESHTGVNLLDDLAAPLGSDVTFAIDGPLLPLPAWKLALEVYDPAHLQQSVSTLVDRFNQQEPGDAGKLLLKTDQVNSRTFHSLRLDRNPNLAAYYTFVDGYLLAGSSEADLLKAIQDRQSGHTLAKSPSFRAQLPDDGYTNFSGIVYHNLGISLAPLANQLKASGSLPASQQQAIGALLTNTAPGLICIYGEPDRIVASSRSGFLGFDLGTLAGIERGQPLLPPLMAAARIAAGTGGSGAQPQRR